MHPLPGILRLVGLSKPSFLHGLVTGGAAGLNHLGSRLHIREGPELYALTCRLGSRGTLLAGLWSETGSSRGAGGRSVPITIMGTRNPSELPGSSGSWKELGARPLTPRTDGQDEPSWVFFPGMLVNAGNIYLMLSFIAQRLFQAAGGPACIDLSLTPAACPCAPKGSDVRQEMVRTPAQFTRSP